MKKLIVVIFSFLLLSSPAVFADFGDVYNCKTLQISETDVYLWINTNDDDKNMDCIESIDNKIRLRKKCGWSIVLQNIETGG